MRGRHCHLQHSSTWSVQLQPGGGFIPSISVSSITREFGVSPCKLYVCPPFLLPVVFFKSFDLIVTGGWNVICSPSISLILLILHLGLNLALVVLFPFFACKMLLQSGFVCTLVVCGQLIGRLKPDFRLIKPALRLQTWRLTWIWLISSKNLLSTPVQKTSGVNCALSRYNARVHGVQLDGRIQAVTSYQLLLLLFYLRRTIEARHRSSSCAVFFSGL